MSSQPENKTLLVHSSAQFNFCPQCGAETEKEEIPVGTYKTNLEVSCPTHGVIVVSQ